MAGASPSSERSATFGSWGPSAFILVAVVVGVAIAVSSSSDTQSVVPVVVAPAPAFNFDADDTAEGPADEAPAADDIGQVVDETAADDSGAGAEAGTMEPKNASLDRFFAQDFKTEEPFLHDSEGGSFKTFQKAFFSKTDRPIYDKAPIAKGFTNSFDGLKDYLKDHEVPESLLASMHASGPSGQERHIFSGNADLSDSEARMLASEAFQSVPTAAAAAAPEAVDILREILSARMECQRLGLKLPEAPEDQVSAIKKWSRTVGPAAEIAKNILSRM